MDPALRQQIVDTAARSPVMHYAWHDRGIAPPGYVKGLALAFGECYLQLKAGGSSAQEMAKPIGGPLRDAMAHYAPQFRAANMMDNAPPDILRHLFVLMYGLGMRESSGVYNEGRDMSASNVSADTAEAGLFQQSWNSHVASSEMAKLLSKYGTAGAEDCMLDVFKEGVHHHTTPSYGRGTGRIFQDTAKTCPMFAAACCAVGLRNIRRHWGPINRHEAEVRSIVNLMLLNVQRLIDAPAPPAPTSEDTPVS